VTLVLTFLSANVVAQDNVSLQVKTFDQDLKPLPDIQIAFNELDYFTIGNKGTAIIEVNQSEIPIRAIRVKDERLEAASWNLSKGTIEIIVRPVSYKVIHVTLRFADNTGLANTPVKFHGSKTINVTSDQSGKFDLPISLYETVQSAGQFEIANVLVTDMQVDDNKVTLMIERPRPRETPPQHTTIAAEKPNPFDVAQLDSINSLSEFYAMFRNISMNGLDEDVRQLVDEKFRQLVALRQDSINAARPAYIKEITDTSLVIKDIRNLLKQATAEHTTLLSNREEFENKIVVISSKLQRGVVNLSSVERDSLLRNIDMLEQLLTDNESQFYENHNDYREIINTLREKYLEVEQLQNRLSEAERERIEQDKEFRQRLFGIGAVVVAFGFLIILLITFSTRLRRQTKSLKAANESIEQINENLEAIVARRTHLLEEANKELDTFLYRASHDLRSPVLSLMGLCQIIDYIDRDEMVQHVRMATRNMDRVITKLVDISEISQEAKNHKTFTVLDTINKVRNKHLVTIDKTVASRDRGTVIVRKRPVQFNVDCPEGLQIHASPSLVEIILSNLVENAIFFASLKRSDDPVFVDVKARTHDDKIEISVYDNGIGIPKLIQPRIFNMFFSGNEGSKGSGLGLYTAKKCVTALHGDISFESEEGKFTRFTVVIPITQPAVQGETQKVLSTSL
jgi:signal transduction histidine kinase